MLLEAERRRSFCEEDMLRRKTTCGYVASVDGGESEMIGRNRAVTGEGTSGRAEAE